MQVRVAGWSTPRSIIVEGDYVLFEVAEADGCSACLSRIAHVRRTLTAKNIAVDLREVRTGYGNTLYVVLGPPAAGVDLRDHVGQLLNLSLS